MTVPLLFIGSLWIYPEPIFLVAYTAGSDGERPLPQSLKVKQVIDELNRTSLAIGPRSAILAQEPNGGLWKWQTPDGVFWAPPETSVPFLLSEQATRVYGDGERRVRQGDVVLDRGANIGTFTHEALQAGAKLVVAIEPSERNVEALRRTFAKQIEEGRVIVYPKGVWHREEELKFYDYDNSALDSAILEERPEEGRKPNKVRVPVQAIDNIMAELKLERVEFIKMDVEGAEHKAMEGAQATLAKFHPRMSVAMENLPDDQYVVSPIVKKAWPQYRVECGRCSLSASGRTQQDVMYF
ncbi:MAG: FkbM family methyltransferase [Acidobacteria bacterium]|nr:FkbM family methyltransferase [Acidobacteriota bacterium]